GEEDLTVGADPGAATAPAARTHAKPGRSRTRYRRRHARRARSSSIAGQFRCAEPSVGAADSRWRTLGWTRSTSSRRARWPDTPANYEPPLWFRFSLAL